MEPGEYSTNILASSNYAYILYEYFEFGSLPPPAGRKKCYTLEADWRAEGLLAFCDPSRDGIWTFKSASGSVNDTQGNGVSDASSAFATEMQVSGLVLKEKGVYEPSNLSANQVRSRLTSSNSFGGSSVTSSPSSSLNTTVQSLQTFNSKSAQANSAPSINNEPQMISPGMKSASALFESWPSPKDIHECFISAVLGSIVFFLCRDHAFMPLNSRTLISDPLEAAPSDFGSVLPVTDAITLATLDISLTSLGTLIIKGHSDIAPGLQSLRGSSVMGGEIPVVISGTALWLAPGGNAAKYYGSQIDKDFPGDMPISQLQANITDQRVHGFNGATIQSWKNKCLEWLSTKGLNSVALEEGGWIFVQILSGNLPYFNAEHPSNSFLEDLAIVPWPALLCFQTTNSTNRELPILPFTNSSRDPLAVAEEWFLGKDDRSNLSSKRLKERLAAEARSKEQADVDARNTQANIYSPVALRRGSIVGAMYPTPPDAIQHLVGATPSFDGNVTTPSNHHNMFAQDLDHVPQTTVTSTGMMESDGWPSSGGKERSNIGIGYNDDDNDNSNLFGDDGEGDLFGDITDADFNFFDEPDAMEISEQVKPTNDQVTHVSKDDVKTIDETVVDAPVSQPIEVPDTVMPDFIKTEETPKLLKVAHFVVPELKEKRSATKSSRKVSLAKVPPTLTSPPFNMDSVYKDLVRQMTSDNVTKDIRRASVFSKVAFHPNLSSVDVKYSTKGRFNFPEPDIKSSRIDMDPLPTTDYLKRRQKNSQNGQPSRNIARILQASAPTIDTPQCVDDDMIFFEDIDSSSSISEQDDISHTTDEMPVVLNAGFKRKWAHDDSGDDVASSLHALAVDYTQSVGTPLSSTGPQMPLLEADSADWSLASYFITPEPEFQSTAISDLECIASAQILADQAISGTIRLPLPGASIASEAQLYMEKIFSTKNLMRKLTKAALSCLKEVPVCSMRSFLDIQGIPAVNQGNRLPPRPTPHPRGTNMPDPSRLASPFLIPPPQLEVRRSDSKLTVFPSAINFWDNLGLGPSKGNKDVQALCVYPNFDGLVENATIFLDQMRSTYESSRLGSHDRIITKDIPNGLIPFTVDPPLTNKSHQLSTLKDTTGLIGKVLSAMSMEEKNIVVYFIYPLHDPTILVHICTSFRHLFNTYKKILSDKKAAIINELVLQLVPIDFITSLTSLVVRSPAEYAQLAMEVYDRCIEFTTYSSTSAILLEQPLPKSIDFKLSPSPSASLFQEHSCLHIAYAQSIDDRWISAAWTDNRGSQRMTASYCLGRKNEALSMPFSGIANEIWQTTLEIIARKRVHWRIMIVRVGVMDPSEAGIWTGLVPTESDVQVTLTLITAQTDPSLRLIPPSVTLTPTVSASQSVITPVSTPQALQTSIMSPENASTPTKESTAATPGDPVEPDSDARLVDFTDQSWGAILSHRLNNSNSLLDVNPALISGYLLKRGGSSTDDSPVAMEVNIVYSEVVGNPRTFHETLLRELLVYYRGLGTLARVRGVVDSVKDVRPWHIAAAEKAVKALYQMM